MAHSFRQIELLMAAERKIQDRLPDGNQGHPRRIFSSSKRGLTRASSRTSPRSPHSMNSPRCWHGMKADGYLAEQPIPERLIGIAGSRPPSTTPTTKAIINGDWRPRFDFGNGAFGMIGRAHLRHRARIPQAWSADGGEPDARGHNLFIFPRCSTLAFRFRSAASNRHGTDLA